MSWKTLIKPKSGFEKCRSLFYIAYKNNEIVGRIAAIINWVEVNDQKNANLFWLV
jgi:hypothetical protein